MRIVLKWMGQKLIRQRKEEKESITELKVKCLYDIWRYLSGAYEKKIKSNISRKGTETLFHGGADNLSPVF